MGLVANTALSLHEGREVGSKFPFVYYKSVGMVVQAYATKE